jgi:nucleotide-binding universal stress UspA family protein
MIRILVPVDFSAHSFHALNVASRLAELSDGSLEVIFIKHHKRMRTGEIWNKNAWEKLQNEDIEDVMEWFISDSKNLLDKNHEFPYHIRETKENESDSIAYFAETEGFDYILMGTLGADAFKNVLLGSTTFNLTEISKIPVIAIPEECQCTTIKKVVYAINFRKIAEKPLKQIMGIVQILEAKLICLHVDYSETRELHSLAEDLEEKYNSLGNIRFEVIQALNVPDGIFNYIQDKEIDFLAIGHRKESFLKKLFRFSYTENLLLHSHVPVMVFPPDFGK